jgi:ubiquinone/menaquinone biosynthesis C-methylase UbiE
MSLLTLLSTGKGPMDGWIARAYDQGVQAAFRDILPALAEDIFTGMEGARRGLDVGCGPGQFTILIAERASGAKIWGIDLAPTMIELARRHAAESAAADRLHFEVADVAELPFPDDYFDAVISSGSIKHWPDQVSALREIHRVLVPGGHAFIGEMNRLASAPAIAAQRARLKHWLFRLIYPRVFTKAMSPEEARAVFAASPFGAPEEERMLLNGVFWVFRVRKAPRTDSNA